MLWGNPWCCGTPPHSRSLLPTPHPPIVPPPGHPVSPTMTSYRQELEKYRDIDEDKILQELSAEELEQLDMELMEMDPEVGAGVKGMGRG